MDGLVADALRGRQPHLCDVVAKVPPLHSAGVVGVQGRAMFTEPATSVTPSSCRGTRPATINRLKFRTFGPSRLRCDELWRRRGHRMSSIEPIPCQSSSSTSLLWSMQLHQLSNGGDQHRLEGWKHLLPDSEEEFMDVLETANVLHAKDGLFVDEKPSAPPGDETDAENFAIREDDDVAEEQEQADEVAEEPVFAKDGPPHHVEEPRPEEPPTPVQVARSSLGPRQCVCRGPCSCKGPSVDDRGCTSTCRRVQAASAHLPDDCHRAL